MSSTLRTYRFEERPDVEVLVDGVWLVGELRAWLRPADGAWVANVQYRPVGEPTRHLETVPADRVREAPDPYAGRTPVEQSG